jgi:hypothetical protein
LDDDIDLTSAISRFLTTKVVLGLGIAAPLVFLISAVANMFTTVEFLLKYLPLVMSIAGAVVLVYTCYYPRLIKRYRTLVDKFNEQKEQIIEQKDKYERLVAELEKEVSEGKRLLKNGATITMDIENKKYLFKFEKEYTIISSSNKWYSAQFYANKILDNAEKSQQEYRQKPVSWDSLNCQAFLSHRKEGEEGYSNPVDAYVKKVAEGNNYKQFHIEYKTSEGDSLDVGLGSDIKLTYSYEVPIDLWGSYLNRYVSYFKEDASVTIVCKDKDKLRHNNLKVYRYNENGIPVIVENIKWENEKVRDNGLDSRSIALYSEYQGRYVIWWSADNFFDVEGYDTPIGPDESQLTKY